MKSKLNVVTVINSITETSMPYNEFVLFRHSLDSDNKQTIIVCSDAIPSNIQIPSNIKVYCVGYGVVKLRNAIKSIENESKICNEKVVYHIHQPKAAGIFYLSLIFNPRRRNTVFTIHSLYKAYNFKNKILSLIGTFLSNTVTCVSEASYKEYPQIVKKIKANKMLVIKNGVDTNRIDEVTTSQIMPNENNEIMTLVYVARMIPIKNHEFLIDIFSELNKCKLILIGAEDEKGKLRRKINNMGLSDRVEILGLVPRNDVYMSLMKADVYVSPSLIEGLPISVLEAMYIGLPVVISDIEPHREILKFCNMTKPIPLDKKIWKEKLIEYCNKSSSELEEIGRENRECAKNQFSLTSMIKRYDEIYINI